jgi:hypothetical protein
MTWPAGIGTCTVTGTYLDGTGTPLAGGTVSFTYPGYQLVDGTDKRIVTGGTVTANITNGAFSIVLPFTDNAAVVPSGWSYMVSEQLPSGLGTQYYLSLPTSTGSTADIATLIRTPNPAYPVFPTAPFIPESVVTTKGDLLAATAAGTVVRLPLGTNGQVLTVNTGAAAGVNWAAGGGGGGTLPTVRQSYFTAGAVTFGSDAAWTLYTGVQQAIPGSVGDWVEMVVGGMWQPAGDFIDWAVIGAGGTAVRYSSTNTNTPAIEGDPAFYPGTGFVKGTGLFAFQATSTDIVGGNITFTVAHKGTPGGGVLYASTSYPLRMRLLNLHTVT